MALSVRNLAIPCITILFCNPAYSQTNLNKNTITYNASQLNQHSFESEGFTFTFDSLNSNRIRIKVKNSSPDLRIFAPEDLAIVSNDGDQLYIESHEGSTTLASPVARIQVVPTAHFEKPYVLSGSVHFPAKVFYKGKLLVEVTK